jgi:hypothetical protein
VLTKLEMGSNSSISGSGLTTITSAGGGGGGGGYNGPPGVHLVLLVVQVEEGVDIMMGCNRCRFRKHSCYISLSRK